MKLLFVNKIMKLKDEYRDMSFWYYKAHENITYELIETRYILSTKEDTLMDADSEFIKAHVAEIENCSIDEEGNIKYNDNTVVNKVHHGSGKLVQGYNDLHTWCKINSRLDLLKEYSDGNEKSVHEINRASNTKVTWKCRECGEEFDMAVDRRTGLHRGCPKCSAAGTSKYEQFLYDFVKKSYPDAVNRYRDFGSELDIYIPSLKIAIEFDGGIWHGFEGDIVPKEDADSRFNKKLSICNKNSVKLFRLIQLSSLTDKAVGEINSDTFVFKTDSCNNLSTMQEALDWVCAKLSIKSCKLGITEELNAQQLAKKACKSNSVAALYPEVADIWHPTLNGNNTPENTAAGSIAKIYLVCGKCGYGKNGEWLSMIKNNCRSGCGCPVCTNRKVIAGINDLATTNPEMLDEWNYEFNSIEGKTPQNTSKGAKYKPFWTCKECGYGSKGEWRATLSSRIAAGVGCPQCSNRKDLCKTTNIKEELIEENFW